MRAVIALGAGLFVLAALSAAPALPSEAKCRATLVYRGVVYHGLEASHLGLRAGGVAGIGLEPECDDTPPVTQKFRRVAVRRIAGVRPRMAVARRDVPNIIYVAADRCRRMLGTPALVRCLRRSR